MPPPISVAPSLSEWICECQAFNNQNQVGQRSVAEPCTGLKLLEGAYGHCICLLRLLHCLGLGPLERPKMKSRVLVWMLMIQLYSAPTHEHCAQQSSLGCFRSPPRPSNARYMYRSHHWSNPIISIPSQQRADMVVGFCWFLLVVDRPYHQPLSQSVGAPTMPWRTLSSLPGRGLLIVSTASSLRQFG